MSDNWGRSRIIKEGVEVLEEYDSQITVRQLYYRLVARGLPNNQNNYKRVVAATTEARWHGDMDFDAFLDRERDVFGETKAEETVLTDQIDMGKSQIESWMNYYSKNRWENQPKYVEVWIEKKALQGVFEGPCEEMDVALFPCKGYPSLTALHEAKGRFNEAYGRGQEAVILYFGDHDPSGDDIPRSIGENIDRMHEEIRIERIALTGEQVQEWGLPPAPTKATDSRSRKWDGLGQVELDAVEPRQLQQMVKASIAQHFDKDLYMALQTQEEEERKAYRDALVDFVNSMAKEGA